MLAAIALRAGFEMFGVAPALRQPARDESCYKAGRGVHQQHDRHGQRELRALDAKLRVPLITCAVRSAA
jgi:hypothetical protein